VSSNQNLVFIHGWGSSVSTWKTITERLKDKFNIFIPSLPWPEKNVLSFDDYCLFILDYLKSNKIEKPILIGHSLGGAIATKIASDYPTLPKAIILLASASIRHPLPQPWRLIQSLTSLLKPILRPFRHQILKLTKLDASDYESLKTSIEKDTFKNLISFDQSDTLSKIICPTLILWGENDPSTPLADGKLIHSLIKKSSIQTFLKSGHFFFLDHQLEATDSIIKFIKNETV